MLLHTKTEKHFLFLFVCIARNGSSFLFDEKDNINIKVFITNGSIWNSDYSSNSSDIDLRTSLGTSFDFITAVGPISFSYAIPIEKNNNDRTREFNFTIGTSF